MHLCVLKRKERRSNRRSTASIEREIKEEMRLVYMPGEPEKALFEVFLENGGGTTSTIVAAILIIMLSLWMMFMGKLKTQVLSLRFLLF